MPRKEVYTFDKLTVEKLAREVRKLQTEVVNLRRRMATFGVRRHEAVWMPPQGALAVFFTTESSRTFTDSAATQQGLLGPPTVQTPEQNFCTFDATTDEVTITVSQHYLITLNAAISVSGADTTGASDVAVTLDLFSGGSWSAGGANNVTVHFPINTPVAATQTSSRTYLRRLSANNRIRLTSGKQNPFTSIDEFTINDARFIIMPCGSL